MNLKNNIQSPVLSRQTNKLRLDKPNCDSMSQMKYFRASKHNIEILEVISNQSEFIRDAINFFFEYGVRRKDNWCKKKHTECISETKSSIEKPFTSPPFCPSNPNSVETPKQKLEELKDLDIDERGQIYNEWLEKSQKIKCPHRKERIKVWYSQEHFNRRLNKIFEPYEVYTKEELNLIINPPE